VHTNLIFIIKRSFRRRFTRETTQLLRAPNVAGCVGAGALRNVFWLLPWHGLHKGIIVLPRKSLGEFREKVNANLSTFALYITRDKRYKKQRTNTHSLCE